MSEESAAEDYSWDNADLLYRQVHPIHQTDGKPSSEAFNPSKAHKLKLSVDDARLTTPEKAHQHFTEKLGLQSAGTWAVTVGEVLSTNEVHPDDVAKAKKDGKPEDEVEVQKLKIIRAPVEDDEDATKSNPAHCLIDFNEVSSKGRRKKRAQALAIFATDRGCLSKASGE